MSSIRKILELIKFHDKGVIANPEEAGRGKARSQKLEVKSFLE